MPSKMAVNTEAGIGKFFIYLHRFFIGIVVRWHFVKLAQ